MDKLIFNLLSFVFLFDHSLYLLHGVAFFVKFGSPQGLPQTNISHRRMLVNVAAEQTFVSECR